MTGNNEIVAVWMTKERGCGVCVRVFGTMGKGVVAFGSVGKGLGAFGY